MGQLRELRTALRAESPEADVVLTRMLHSLKHKMAWASDEPALIWQVWGPSIAGEFLRKRDKLVEEGKQPHRVTELFAGLGQPLRRDMERHAAGQGMSSKLCAELLAYSLAKIDDTWAEAEHRNVSLFSGRTPRSKVAYMAAAHRREQHLALYDSLSPGQQDSFGAMLKAHKRIGQRGGQKKLRLLRKRKVRRDVLDSFVYRYDSASTRDWREVLSKETLNFLPVKRTKKCPTVRLQREYLHHIVPEGEVLSFPASAVAHGPAPASSGHDFRGSRLCTKQVRSRSGPNPQRTRSRRTCATRPACSDCCHGRHQMGPARASRASCLCRMAIRRSLIFFSSRLGSLDDLANALAPSPLSFSRLRCCRGWPGGGSGCRLEGQLHASMDSCQSPGRCRVDSRASSRGAHLGQREAL